VEYLAKSTGGFRVAFEQSFPVTHSDAAAERRPRQRMRTPQILMADIRIM